MEELELIQQMKTGDLAAFEKWMRIYAPSIERLAIQYGCTPEQAAEVTEATFRTLLRDSKIADEEGRLLYYLYQVAIEKLTHIQLTEVTNKSIFSFEEDQQLYEKIIVLEKKKRIVFILSQFHGMNNLGISSVLDMSEAAIQESISETYRDLNEQEKKLEKRLEFLGRSYDRFNLLFNTVNVFQGTQGEKEKLIERKTSLSKKVLFTWVAGIVTLLALVTVSVVTGEEYQNSSSEKYIEKLKSEFEDEVANKFTELGITEEKDLGEEFFLVTYAESARVDFEMMTKKLEEQITRKEKINKKEIKQQYEEIVRELELPSEMVERLFENPLTNNKEKSEDFITGYVEKISIVQESYFMLYIDHEQVLLDAIIDGEIDFEKFLKEKDSYPEDLQNILEGMISQNFYPISIPDWAPFYPKHVNNEISKRIRDSLHEDVEGYITLLESAPFIYYPNLAYSIEESIDYMIEIEKTLLASEMQTRAYEQLEGTYVQLLNEIIIGSETARIVGANGRVKEENRIGWKRIASLDESLPSAFIMRKVVDEMEASDWKGSKIYRKLDFNTLYNALNDAKQGNLSTYTLEEDGQQGEITISPKDPEYQTSVEKIYEEFSNEHDRDYLQNENPLVVLGVYYLANEREDPETMWHLFNHEHISVSLEDYVNDWTQVEPLLEEVETLSVNMGGSSLNGMPHVPISYEKGGITDYFAWMIVDEDYSNLWTIQAIPENIEVP